MFIDLSPHGQELRRQVCEELPPLPEVSAMFSQKKTNRPVGKKKHDLGMVRRILKSIKCCLANCV